MSKSQESSGGDLSRRKSDVSGEGERLDAGLRAAFEDESNESSGMSHRSVIEILGKTTGRIPRVSLRDIGAEYSPLHRPAVGRGAEEIPRQIGRYRVAGEIARGGVGSVLKARDEDLGRDIALKVLLEEYRESPEMTRRFLEEAQIGGQLQHPGIVPVHEMGLFAGKRPYFAMKLVKGKTLASLLEGREAASADRQRFLKSTLKVGSLRKRETMPMRSRGTAR